MSVKTLEDVKYINFTSHDTDGSLVALEENDEIPFEIKRIFYVKGVKTLDWKGDGYLPRWYVRRKICT